MFRFIFFTLSIILFFGGGFSFSVVDISLDYEEAKDIGLAAFMIEKTIDEYNLPRDRVVDIIQQFGAHKGISTDSRFLALLTMIDFTNRGAKLNTTGALHYHEYIGGMQFSASTKKDSFRNGFMCPDGKFMSDEAKAACYTTDVLTLVDTQIIEPQAISASDREKFRLGPYIPVIGCLGSGDTTLTKTRRYLGDTTYVRHERSIDITQSNESSIFVAQILPLREWNYGSTGPAGFACQSVFHRIQKIEIE